MVTGRLEFDLKQHFVWHSYLRTDGLTLRSDTHCVILQLVLTFRIFG